MRTALIVAIVAIGLALAFVSAAQKMPALHVDVDMVLVPVTVTDERNRNVTNLRKEHFQIWEDRVEQKIASISTEDAPMSLGILLDTSGSMKGTLREAGRNVGGCLKRSDLSDEFFLVLFASRAQSATEFTTDIRPLQDMILFLDAKGQTALYDAVYKGLVKVKEGVNPRKALVIATDGYENNSRHHARELKEMIKEQDVQIYTMGNKGDGAIRELAQITGGRELSDVGTGSLGIICSAMVRELKNQYILGYKSTNRARDGRWRSIRVKLAPPGGLSNLSARYKREYFVPVDKAP